MPGTDHDLRGVTRVLGQDPCRVPLGQHGRGVHPGTARLDEGDHAPEHVVALRVQVVAPLLPRRRAAFQTEAGNRQALGVHERQGETAPVRLVGGPSESRQSVRIGIDTDHDRLASVDRHGEHLQRIGIGTAHPCPRVLQPEWAVDGISNEGQRSLPACGGKGPLLRGRARRTWAARASRRLLEVSGLHTVEQADKEPR